MADLATVSEGGRDGVRVVSESLQQGVDPPFYSERHATRERELLVSHSDTAPFSEKIPVEVHRSNRNRTAVDELFLGRKELLCQRASTLWSASNAPGLKERIVPYFDRHREPEAAREFLDLFLERREMRSYGLTRPDTHDFAHRETPKSPQPCVFFFIPKTGGHRRDVSRCWQDRAPQIQIRVVASRRG